MAAIKDTYVLETKLASMAALLAELTKVESAVEKTGKVFNKGLNVSDASKLSQKSIEGITKDLQDLLKVQSELKSNKGAIISGEANAQIVRAQASVAKLKESLLEIGTAAFAKGGTPLVDALGIKDMFKALSTSRRALAELRAEAEKAVGGAGKFAAGQIDDRARKARLGGVLRSEQGALATEATSKAFSTSKAGPGTLKKLIGGDEDLAVKTMALLNKLYADGETKIKNLAEAGKRFVESQREQEANRKKALSTVASETAAAEKKKAVDEALARVQQVLGDRERERIRSLIDLRNELRSGARAATEASTAIGAVGARFAALGGERAAKALQELTEAFAKNNTTAAQRARLTDELITKYEREAAAIRLVSNAVNQEGIERARLRTVAAQVVEGQVLSGGLTGRQGSRALEAVNKRVESGELKTNLQVQQAITAEITKQREIERAITVENRLQTDLVITEKREQNILTTELARQARALGFSARLHGDMRAVIAQTVAEAQKLGLTYGRNTAEIEALLRANVELKALQSEAGPRELNQFGVAFAAGFAAQQIGQGLTLLINRFAEFEDELIKVRRTADASRETMSVLGQEILNIGQRVPVAAKQLASAAAVLGQAGAIAFDPNTDYDAGSEKIQDAAKAIELVSQVALVAELNIEQAATSYGQFAVVFSKDVDRITTSLKAMGVEGVSTSDAMRVLFGSINEVGNKTVATTEDILTFIRQFGGTAASFGIAAEKVAALGGAVRDAGAHADVAGTAFVRFFSRATQDADEFGKVLNISADAFRARFSADALGTVVEVFKELGKQSKTNKLAVTDFLRSLKVESREQGVFTKIIENYALLETRLEYGQDLAKNYNSVQSESAKRAETWSASVAKLSNAFQALVQTLEPSIEIFSKIVSLIADLIKAVSSQAWTVFLTTGVVIGGGIAFAVLQAVKLVNQFLLAAQAVRAMNAQMGEFIAQMQRANNLPPPAPPGGGPTARGGRAVGIASGVAAVATAGLIAVSFVQESGEEGKKAGEAVTKGMVEGLEKGKPEIEEAAEETAKAATQSWLTAIAGVTLAAAALIPIGITIVTSMGAVAAAFAAATAAVIAYNGAVTFTALAAFAGIGATIAVFTAGIIAAAAAGWAFGRMLDNTFQYFQNWIFGLSEFEEVREEIERLNYAGESWERIQKAIGASLPKLTKPFEDGVAAIKKANVASTTLLNTWRAMVKVAYAAKEPTGSVSDLFEKLSKTTDLTEAKELFDAIQKTGESDIGELTNNVDKATKAFKGLLEEVENLTGRKIETPEFFDENGIKLSAEAAKKALTEEGDKLRAIAAINIDNLNKAREKARTSGNEADVAALISLEQQNDYLMSRLKAIGVATRQITVDAVAEFAAAIAATAEGESARNAVNDAAKSKVDALRKAALQDFNKSMDGIGKIINELEEKAETGASAVIEDYAGKRADFFNKLNAQVKAAALLDTGGELAKAATQFSKAWDDAFAAAWGKAAKTAVREAFDELKAVVAANFDELDLEKRGEELAISKLEADGRDRLQQIADEKDALKKYADAVKRGATALESFKKIGVDASTSAVKPLKEAESAVDGLADSFFTTADAMRDAFADASAAMVDGGVKVEDTFFAIQKAAKDTAKLLKQTAFDVGIEEGGKEVDRTERDKGVTKTLRQSSTARNLVGDIRQVRSAGGPVELQGAEIGRLIRKAELKFEEQGVDAGDFLSKVKEELGDTFKQDDKNNPALAIREVGAKTNDYLSQIATVLGAKNTSQQGAAVASALGSDKKRPSSAREFTARAREAGNEIVKLEKEAAGIRDPAEKRRRDLEIRNKTDALDKANVEFAIDEAFSKSGLLKKKGSFQQGDVDKANKILSDLLLSPKLDKLKGAGIEELRGKALLGEDLVDFEGLNAARDRSIGKSRENITPTDNRLAETATNASEAVKAQAEAHNGLITSLDALVTALGNAKYTERIKSLEDTINKTKTAVGGGG